MFDDTDPEEAEYIGMTKIPLIPLAHDKAVKGTFELRKVMKCYNLLKVKAGLVRSNLHSTIVT